MIHSTQRRVCGRRGGADFPCRRGEPADLEILGGGGVFPPLTASRLCKGRGANNPRSAVPNPWHIRRPPSPGEACRLAPSTGAAGRLPAPCATALRRTTPPPDGMNSVASSSSHICCRNLLQRRGRGGGPPLRGSVLCRTVEGVRAVSLPQSAATNARATSRSCFTQPIRGRRRGAAPRSGCQTYPPLMKSVQRGFFHVLTNVRSDWQWPGSGQPQSQRALSASTTEKAARPVPSPLSSAGGCRHAQSAVGGVGRRVRGRLALDRPAPLDVSG